MTVPPLLQSVLWNARVETMDTERDSHTLITSVLMHGGAQHVHWLFATYGQSRIRNWVVEDARGLRTLPLGDRRFWVLVLAPAEWTPEEESRDITERWRPRRVRA